MSFAGKTIAAVAAAAAVGGGIVGVNYLSKESIESKTPEAVDDVVAVSVEIPKVEIPKVAVYKVDVPGVNLVRVVTELELEKINLPKTAAIDGQFGQIGQVGQVVVIPSPEGARIAVPSAGGDVVAIPTPDGYRIVVPEVADPAARMPQLIALQKIQQVLFRDQRNLMYDKSIGIDSAIWAKWIAIYKADAPYSLEHVKLEKGLRMIAEVTAPQSADEIRTLDANLEHYKKLGYNAALLTFDCTEELYRLLDLAGLIRSKELAVWIAYSGPEDLRHSVFADPDRLSKFLSELGAVSDGFVIGWRRTALHLFEQDRQFYNVMLKAVRSRNKNIRVLGEAYIGETASTPEYTRTVSYNVPANVSGVIVSGLGFYGVNVEGALHGVFAPVEKFDRVALIVGEKPYHMTLHKTATPRARQEIIKNDLELRFLRAGCAGTITLHGDGGTIVENGIKKITDSLTGAERL